MTTNHDDRFNFQEPCCIEKSLPLLLRRHHFAAWQTNGDVTFDKILKAVASMAGNALRITLVVPEADASLLRTLSWYLRRGWLEALTLLTHADEGEAVRREFPNDFLLEYFFHKSVSDSLMVIQGEISTVVVQGPLHALPAASANVERFTTYFGRNSDQISMLAGTTFSRLSAMRRSNKRRHSSDEDAAPSTEEAETPILLQEVEYSVATSEAVDESGIE